MNYNYTNFAPTTNKEGLHCTALQSTSLLPRRSDAFVIVSLNI